MARPSQIEFPGAIYHVMSRGNRKQASTPGSLSGPAKPVRGRRPTNLKPETGLDPAKPSDRPVRQHDGHAVIAAHAETVESLDGALDLITELTVSQRVN